MKLSKSIVLTSLALISSAANANHMIFDSPGSFDWVVPVSVTSVKVLLVGGGGGGANGHQGGGAAGFVKSSEFAVLSGQTFSILVGSGGTGADTFFGDNAIVGISSGGKSAFGSLFEAAGGGVVTSINGGGHDGSSGGGAACNAGSLGGAGGTGGAAGLPCQSGASMPTGLGQGDYSNALSIFTEVTISFGAGGAGGTGSHAGGGGGGGVLINGVGPTASSGIQSFSGAGGFGYGAGGGAGGYNGSPERWAGGDGASGLVYLEFNAPAVPEPSTWALSLIGAAAVSIVIRQRRRSANSSMRS